MCLEEIELDLLEEVARGWERVLAVGERVEAEWEERALGRGLGGVVSAHLVTRRLLIKEELPVII